MSAKTTMCIMFRDETVETVFIDRTVLGAQVRFAESLPRDELVFEEIARLMKAQEKMPARVLLCPPRDMIMQRTLTYPAMAPADIAGMVQFEATRHVPLAENERAIGWGHTLLEEEKKVVLNLVAARSADLQELIGKFQALDVPVDEAVPFSSALVPGFGSVPTLLVLTDTGHVELCLYGQGQLRDSQMIASDAPGFSPERVITAARQMTAKNREWLGAEGIGRVLLGGNATLSEVFSADLGAAFGLPVQALELPAGFQALEKERAGILMAASVELPAELNLIEHAGRKVPMSRKTMSVYALCALLLIELIAWFGFRTGAPALQRKQVAEEIASVRRRAAPIQRMKDRNRDMRRQLYRLDEISRSHVSSMQVLKGLSDLLPEDTFLYLVVYKEGNLYFRGASKEPDRIPELLMESPFVEAVSKSDIGKKEGDYHAITMNVSTRSPHEETEY